MGNRNDSADRMQDLQTLVDQWAQNKDLKNPVNLKTFGIKVTGKENIMTDSTTCKKTKSMKKLAKAYTLPTPDTCPSH